MSLLNYTTRIGVSRTVSQIQNILAKHGAKSITMEYGDAGEIEALLFEVATPYGDINIRLPVDPDAVLKVLMRQNLKTPVKLDREHANRVAWRIVKDWVEAQMAILETEMVRMEQIFLPYAVMRSGKTLYEAMMDSRFQLPEGER